MSQATTSAPGLDVFLSFVQSLGSELASSTQSRSTLATLTSTPQTTSSAGSSTTTASTSATSSTPTTASIETSTPSAAAAVASSSTGLNSTAREAIIIVCAIVGALLLALLALFIWCCVRRHRKRRRGDPLSKEGPKEISEPLQADEWYHGNNSHHGYIGGTSASASRTEMAQRRSQDKNLAPAVSRIEDSEPPDLANHPAYAKAFERDGVERGSDPYTAAGVGVAGPAGPAMGAAATRNIDADTPRRSMGERRLSDHMPTRKPVGSPPSIPGRNPASNPLTIDTSRGALEAGTLGAAAGALAGGTAGYHHNQSHSDPQYFASSRRISDPFASPPIQHPTPKPTSPLSSHPSTHLLASGSSRKHDSYQSQGSLDATLQSDVPARQTTPTKLKSKRRPPTPLGFDFGLPPLGQEASTPAREPGRQQEPEAEPLNIAYDHEPESTQQSYPAARSRFNSRQPVRTAYADTRSTMNVTSPTAAQRTSLDRRNQHYLNHDIPDSSLALSSDPNFANEASAEAPLVPQRSPRRLSRGSFDEPMASAHAPVNLSDSADIAIPPRSPKRFSWNRSGEDISNAQPISSTRSGPGAGYGNVPQQDPNSNIFRDSGDFAYASYPSPRSAYSSSPHRSHGNFGPNIGPALGYRAHRSSSSDVPLPSSPDTVVGHHGQIGSPYLPVRSQAFSGIATPTRNRNHGFPVYATDSGAASSGDSFVSARQNPNQSQTQIRAPPPWDDNAIRRNSSSGHLRRPTSLQMQGSSQQYKQQAASTSAERVWRHVDSGQFPGRGSGGSSLSAEGDLGTTYGYDGPGQYDSGWGEAEVEQPVAERNATPDGTRASGISGGDRDRDRRRSSGSSKGFDPRYGRWTNDTFDEHWGDGLGVGKAL